MSDTTGSPPRSQILDLRQYTLVPGQRERFIELFDTHFVDSQEAVGMHIVGQHRDLDDDNKFVWLRGFDSMPARAGALQAFYYGPIWRAHREAANATMVDSDNALLLRPLYHGRCYPRFGAARAETATESVVSITVLYRDRPVDEECRRFALERIAPQLRAAGTEPVAILVTEPAENNFPVLPLRDENVVVWITRFDGDAAYATYAGRLAGSPTWRDDVLPELLNTATQPLQQLRLRPTDRSHLR